MKTFDLESGQVYSETVVRRGREAVREWDRACSNTKPYNVLSPRGADSLTAMALRKLVCNANHLSADTLAALPEKTSHQIRKAVRREGCETFNIWKAFAESGHEDKTFRFATSTHKFYKPLVNFIHDIVSPSFSWMVDLALLDMYCTPLDLRELRVLDNLQTLQIIYSTTLGREPFDDGVLSNLAYRASNDNSLSKLNMVFISNASGISARSLSCISQFPALETFCIVNTSIRTRDVGKFRAIGWNIDKDNTFQSYAEDYYARRPYRQMLRRRNFADLVRPYVQNRRSSRSTSFWGLPSAEITFSPSSSLPNTAFSFDPSAVRCFERDLSVRSSSNMPTVPSTSLKLQSSQDDTEPATKKRKLRDSKTIGLDKMLEGL